VENKEGSKDTRWGMNYFADPELIVMGVRYTHCVASIKTGRPAQFAYSPFFCRDTEINNANAVIAETTINLTGSRILDYGVANIESGVFTNQPRGTSWHHVWMDITIRYDSTRNGRITYDATNWQAPGHWNCESVMQLVNTSLHAKTCAHAGSACQYSILMGGNYGRINDKLSDSREFELVYSKDIYIPKYTENDIIKFQNDNKIKLQGLIHDIYTRKTDILKQKFYSNNSGDCEIWYVLPLFDPHSTSLDINRYISVEEIYNIQKTNKQNLVLLDYIPFAIDRFGNMFYMKNGNLSNDGIIYFYDHEMNKMSNFIKRA
jgi:hypothetical protein